MTLAKARAIAETWLAAILPAAVTAAGGTGVYRHPAPEEAVEPFVTVNLLGGRSVRPLGRAIIGVERLEYDISAWDRGLTATRAHALAEAVTAAIESGAPATVPGGQIVAAKRTGPLPAPPSFVERGEHYQRDGGQFELMVAVD